MKRFFPSAALVAVISLLLSVIWPSPSIASMPTLSPLGQLRAPGLDIPWAMAVDGAGNLFVADSRGGEIFRFDRYGRLRVVFEAQATGRGLAVSPDGSRLYVARGSRVAVVDAVSGEHLLDLNNEACKQVGEIEVDAVGNVYVADVGVVEQTISVFSPSGRLLAKFGGAGNTAGKFRQLGAMAFNAAGKLVTMDQSALDNRVQIFNVDPISYAATVVGSYLTTSSANFGAPGVVGPRGVAFDSQGRGYFLDYNNSQVRIVSPLMAYLGSYGQKGTAPGQLAYVNDIAVETTADSATGKKNTRLFISCDGGRIEVFGVDGGVSPVFVNSKPTVPVQQSPVAGSEVATTTPLLQFAAATDADGDALRYEVSIYRGDTLVSRANTTATSLLLASGLLAENAAYAWTVEAFDAEGAGSGASLPATFVVNAVDEPPSTPLLVTPLGGEHLDGTGSLAWLPAVDPDPSDTLLGYRVEVASDTAFMSPVLAATVSGTAIALADFSGYAELVDGETYYWRVAATDSDGLVSAPGATGVLVYDTALLKVTANMSGARVYLGGNYGFPGRYVGDVPVELRDLAAGSFSVVVERAGFEPYVAQVAVGEAANAAVYAPLVPARQPAAMQLVGNGINGRSGLIVNGGAAPFLIDFDNNGGLDLLVGDAAGQLTLFADMQLNSRGQLSFQPGKGFALPVLPGAVPFVADWNDDGRKDLLVGQADGSVKLFLNVGEETAPAFGAGQDLAVAGGALNVGAKAAPVVIDLDGDGARDLVVGNAAGQLLGFLNEGTDAAPQLAAAVVLAQLSGAVVPASVDWDADGRRDLLAAVNGQIIPLRYDSGENRLLAGEAQSIAAANAVFPLELNGGKGKDLLVGLTDGKLAFWAGNGSALTAAATSALLVKVDEAALLVADEAPELLGEVGKVRAQIEAGSLGGAGKTAGALALALPAGTAREAVLELGGMCQAK